MRSVRWPPLPAHDLDTLEAKMDGLHRKLDQLLSRSSAGGESGCPMCAMCSQHSREQEATASQLSAHAKLLESLDRKVMEVRTSLEELARERLSDNMSVPVAALQRRKSLPVRASVDEVYVRLDVPKDQKVIQPDFNVPHGRGQTGILIEDSEGEGVKEVGCLLKGDPAEVKVQHEPKSQKEVEKDLSALLHMTPTDEATLSSSSQSSITAGVGLCLSAVTSKALTSPPIAVPKITVTNMTNPSITSSQTQTAAKVTAVVDPGKCDASFSNGTAMCAAVAGPTVLVPYQKMPKTAGFPFAVTTAAPKMFTSVSRNAPQFTVKDITAPPPSVLNAQKASLGVPVTVSQVTGVSSANVLSPQTLAADSKSAQINGIAAKMTAAGDKTLHGNHLPKTAGQTTPLTAVTSVSVTSKPSNASLLLLTERASASHKPPKVPNMDACVATLQTFDKSTTNSQTANPLATKGCTLLPSSTVAVVAPGAVAEGVSLRFQGLRGKSDSAHTVTPPLVKPAATAAMAGGIQIRINAAEDKNKALTKTPPKTCFKIIDDVPPQPAPFPHRCVSLRSNPPGDAFSIHTDVLGGGRFGKVHKCTDNNTGLRLAAKIISVRSTKEREMAVNEIQAMNQLSHFNILQLYDSFETKNQVVLILEYVEGGELFERIVDESCPLTEVDAMVFVKQICEGVQYMHQMYVLHLDLKPENILCVNRSGHQIKIIDFGLARRYKPREKLRVSFGTPEFLAPEVVNFDFVSFPTDMWTIGVVTYMLLSGLSPFLGDDDHQTLNNVLTVNWYFDDDAFEHVSAEAKDFVSNLLIKERGGRLSATQCLKHPWLNNISEKAKSSNIILKSQVLLKKYMARRLWKKNYIAIAAANRFKKICSPRSPTFLGV
ncbi:myosin light chain kinase 2, skeletal/cardiac muscle [Electrophorus electricus]|uniref:myosin light chain kinase 2, skeletal/cardiac muscle n=1 Tax=Electrophorus electricus TaxID=8005 RepID=UPI0015CFE9B7|nr:myosin light chain kinase 2, skeletal/cardiac muscle [Electrophorus electricus]